MRAIGVNVQLGVLTSADVPDLQRFDSALLICDWPEHVPDTLAVLDAASVPVGLWRFCADPRGWPGWPRNYIVRCPWAVLANEQDIEGPLPDWYAPVTTIWHAVNGLLCEPAWSDEAKRRPDGWDTRYSAVSAHVYPLGRGAANLAAVRARANGRPVFVTEFGIAGQQQTCLQQRAALGITEPTWLYTYRARDAQAMPAYNLAGVPLTPVQIATDERIGPMNPSPLFKFDQGPGTLDCWVECIRSFFLRYGYPLDLDTVFQAGKGKARPAGGEAATFAEVKRAIATLAQQLGVQVQTMDCDTPTVVFEALRDPNTSNPWTVIAGVAEQVLQPGQQCGHFMILSGFKDGNEISVVDPLDHYDGNTSGVYPAATLAQAMIANWEPAIDAEAVKIVGKAA